jgi:hypothetical protein
VLGQKVKVRKVWSINPRTRVKKSKKTYSRQKIKREMKKMTQPFIPG